MFDATMIGNSAMIGLFVAMGYALIKVVDYFLNRRKEDDLKKRYITVDEFSEIQKKVLDDINEKVTRIFEMHNVYDENHVPRWFVPAELLKTVREMDMQCHIVNKEVLEALSEIKGGQVVLVEKLSDLINSQKLMTERLSDLVKRLYKLSD